MNKTTFLFPTPSFAQGLARSIDLLGDLNDYNFSQTVADADAKALASDWAATMNDLSAAFDSVTKSIGKK